MALTLAISDEHAALVGLEDIRRFIAGYDQAFPDLQLIADVALIPPDHMRLLNRQQREIDEPTDVLSFPTFPDYESLREHAQHQPTLVGSVVICPEKAKEYGETLIQLVHHGLLHLLGYDHEADFPSWLSEEKRILEVLEQHQLYIPSVPYESV